jgi:hypothetical protein
MRYSFERLIRRCSKSSLTRCTFSGLVERDIRGSVRLEARLCRKRIWVNSPVAHSQLKTIRCVAQCPSQAGHDLGCTAKNLVLSVKN